MDIPDLGSGPVEVAVRTAIVYLFLVLALRVAGRREVGQMSILDLVVVLIIANGVQNAMVGQNTTLIGGLVSAGTLIILDRVLDAAVRAHGVASVREVSLAVLETDGSISVIPREGAG